jgi:hypothetical protein
MTGIVKQFIICAIMLAFAYYAYRRPHSYASPWKLPPRFVRVVMLAVMAGIIAAFVMALFNPTMW